MKVLALDVSTKTGWSFCDGDRRGEIVLVASGVIHCKDYTIDFDNFNDETLHQIFKAVDSLVEQVSKLVIEFNPDVIVIEQTNRGSARFTQKLLEWLHYALVRSLFVQMKKFPKFISSAKWRKTLGISFSKQDKEHNKLVRLNKHKGVKDPKLGKIGLKHLSVRYLNENLKLDFKLKDNDRAEAILINLAYFKGSTDNE